MMSQSQNSNTCLKTDEISPENWMSSLPDSLQHIPLSKLAIPGTHDSGTFSLSCTLSPDTNGCLQFLTKIPLIGSFVNKTVNQWAQCQKLDFTEQLLAGIRYFDLRVVVEPRNEEFYLVHTLLGPKVTDLVDAVLSYLDTHPREIVLLDFNHFYKMGTTDHDALLANLTTKLGPILCKRCNITELTLHNLWTQKKQVIIFYQHPRAQCVAEVWPKESIASPWPNTDNPTACVDFLSLHFSKPREKDFTVCQGVLTPTACTVIKGFYHNGSVHCISENLLLLFCPWLKDKASHYTYPPTIIIADFVEDGDLIQQILRLNYQ